MNEIELKFCPFCGKSTKMLSRGVIPSDRSAAIMIGFLSFSFINFLLLYLHEPFSIITYCRAADCNSMLAEIILYILIAVSIRTDHIIYGLTHF